MNQPSDSFTIFIERSPKANAALLEFFVSASKGSVDFVAAQIIRAAKKVIGGKGESFGEARVVFVFFGEAREVFVFHGG